MVSKIPCSPDQAMILWHTGGCRWLREIFSLVAWAVRLKSGYFLKASSKPGFDVLRLSIPLFPAANAGRALVGEPGHQCAELGLIWGYTSVSLGWVMGHQGTEPSPGTVRAWGEHGRDEAPSSLAQSPCCTPQHQPCPKRGCPDLPCPNIRCCFPRLCLNAVSWTPGMQDMLLFLTMQKCLGGTTAPAHHLLQAGPWQGAT